jgi:hypothetical protein
VTTKTKARMCQGKVRHDAKQAAKDAMWAYVREFSARPSRLNVYPCPHCTGWHWGHRR